MFQNRTFIVILQIVILLFTLLLCCAGIVIGAFISGITRNDAPNMELIINIASIPILLFGNKIVLQIMNIFVIIIIVLLYFRSRKMKK
ncbi:hypothetical protein [Lysinibacillus xylanilyticus]|uniref:hypothetical protein n=1 Tax=Lysinibacillus xylanilyticus TaxID=582475 RepID=UPI003D05D892